MKNKETKKARIKVIKKGEVRQVEKPTVSKEDEKESTRREIVSTVSDWVNELRDRRTDSALAIDQLFSAIPQKA